MLVQPNAELALRAEVMHENDGLASAPTRDDAACTSYCHELIARSGDRLAGERLHDCVPPATGKVHSVTMTLVAP